MRGPTRMFLGALAVLSICLFAPPLAAADHRELDPNWPQLLPGLPDPPFVAPHPVRNCPRAGPACVDDLIRRLRALWQPYDASCDHRAAAALAYLRINEELRRELFRPGSIFRYPTWFSYVLTTFSNRFFAATADYDAGRPVPESWRIAFDAMRDGDISAGQDVLLFSNAHVQHDLPFAYEEMGVVTRSHASRKRDHDAFNEVNNRIQDPVGDELAERYDPTFRFIDLSPSPLDEIGSLQVVKLWREGAWRNAERLARSRTPAERALVVEDIRATSAAWARLIASFEMPGLRALRDEHCRAAPRP